MDLVVEMLERLQLYADDEKKPKYEVNYNLMFQVEIEPFYFVDACNKDV